MKQTTMAQTTDQPDPSSPATVGIIYSTDMTTGSYDHDAYEIFVTMGDRTCDVVIVRWGI